MHSRRLITSGNKGIGNLSEVLFTSLLVRFRSKTEDVDSESGNVRAQGNARPLGVHRGKSDGYYPHLDLQENSHVQLRSPSIPYKLD